MIPGSSSWIEQFFLFLECFHIMVPGVGSIVEFNYNCSPEHCEEHSIYVYIWVENKSAVSKIGQMENFSSIFSMKPINY
jgi:hypothetical protein